MKTKLFLLACSLMSSATALIPVSADERKNPVLSATKIVPVHNGLNEIDIDGDGKPDLIVQGLHPALTAHSYTNTNFYIRSGMAHDQTLLIVPFLDQDFSLVGESLSTAVGADCTVRDMVVLRPFTTRASLIVVEAERDFGRSWVDRRQVTFSIYKLQKDPGSDAEDFVQVNRFRSKGAYCDANYAMQNELGIRFNPPVTDGDFKP